MIASFFNQTKPIRYPITGIIVLLLFVLANDMVFEAASLMKNLFFLGCCYTLVFFVDYVSKKNRLTENNSYVLLLFVLLIAAFPRIWGYNKLLMASFFILLSFDKTIGVYDQSAIKEKVFDSAFWLAVAVLLHPWCVLYIPVLYIGFFSFIVKGWRCFLISILGFCTPLFLMATYLFVTDKWVDFFRGYDVFYISSFSKGYPRKIQIPLIIIAVVGILMMTRIQRIYKNKKNITKKTLSLTIFSLCIGIGCSFFSSENNGEELIFICFPVAVIAANYVQSIEKKWMKDVFLLLFFILPLLRFVL